MVDTDVEDDAEDNDGKPLSISVDYEGDHVVIVVSGVGDEDIDIYMGWEEAKSLGFSIVGVAELVRAITQRG